MVDQKKVTEVVNDIILDRITQMIEDMSNHDFIEFVMDRLEEKGIKIDSEDEEGIEEVTEIVGGRMLPLLHKMSEYLIGKNIPTE